MKSPKAGDRVRVPWSVQDVNGSNKKIDDLLGFIESIDGGYYYIEIVNNKEYDTMELYHGEFIVIEESDPDYQKINPEQVRKVIEKKEAALLEAEKARNLVNLLDIPTSNTPYIHVVDLYRIFTTPKRCEKLISKLKMKAFW